MSVPTTVAEKMMSDLEKINAALHNLTEKGLPMNFITLYVAKKTHLPQKDILAVFEALKDMNREIRPNTAATR